MGDCNITAPVDFIAENMLWYNYYDLCFYVCCPFISKGTKFIKIDSP